MDSPHENPDAAATTDAASHLRPLTEQQSLRKDMSYSPASETETQRKQDDPLPDTIDADIDADDVRVVPGTGGPDDVGDVDVDPDDLNLPGRPSQAAS
ncbi:MULTISPECIES: hypothetical protein [Microbacterium]|uniref:hypothetical protein n=1 Tax=Microbacterium TaxID=33882 RepID=UPI001EF56967|nr:MULTISPECIES: hypothetical protein [Microbacterium]